MEAWWQSLSTLDHVLLYIAVPATLVLLIQTALLFLGGLWDGDGEPGGDTGAESANPEELSGDGDAPPDDSLHILTVRGVVAFFVLFGWGSLWLHQLGLPGFLAVFLGIPIGFAGMVGIALAVREALRLQYDGTLDPSNAVGLSATVYLTIPARRAGPGKVNLTVQEQLREFEALTDAGQSIPTGSTVRVTGLAGRDTLLVEPVPSTDES